MYSCIEKAKEEMDLLLFAVDTLTQITSIFPLSSCFLNINLENIQKKQLTQQPFQIVMSGLFLQV